MLKYKKHFIYKLPNYYFALSRGSFLSHLGLVSINILFCTLSLSFISAVSLSSSCPHAPIRLHGMQSVGPDLSSPLGAAAWIMQQYKQIMEESSQIRHCGHAHLLSASLQLGHVQAIRLFFSPGWLGSSRVRVWSTWRAGCPWVVASWRAPPWMVWTVRCCWPEGKKRTRSVKRRSGAAAENLQLHLNCEFWTYYAFKSFLICLFWAGNLGSDLFFIKVPLLPPWLESQFICSSIFLVFHTSFGGL